MMPIYIYPMRYPPTTENFHLQEKELLTGLMIAVNGARVPAQAIRYPGIGHSFGKKELKGFT